MLIRTGSLLMDSIGVIYVIEVTLSYCIMRQEYIFNINATIKM